LSGNRCWSLSSANPETSVLLLPLMFVEVKIEAWIYIRLSSMNISTITVSDGISYWMSGPACLQVCILDIFLAPNLTDRSGEIPQRTSSPKIEYKPRAPSSANFTGRRNYLAKLRNFFHAESDGPLLPDVGINLPAGMHTRYFSRTKSDRQIR
jgi:hypothetical protein